MLQYFSSAPPTSRELGTIIHLHRKSSEQLGTLPKVTQPRSLTPSPVSFHSPKLSGPQGHPDIGTSTTPTYKSELFCLLPPPPSGLHDTYLCSSSLGWGYCDLQPRRTSGGGEPPPSRPQKGKCQSPYHATGWSGFSLLQCSFMLLVAEARKSHHHGTGDRDTQHRKKEESEAPAGGHPGSMQAPSDLPPQPHPTLRRSWGPLQK